MVGIYADEAITGTKVDKREQFQRMIQDCMDGKIDVCDTKDKNPQPELRCYEDTSNGLYF